MLQSINEVREKFPHLIINEGGEERLKEVFELLPHHPSAGEVMDSFEEHLTYLNNYGGETDDGRRYFKITLGPHRAHLSFSIQWDQLRKDGSYTPWMNGGLNCNAHVQEEGVGSFQFGDAAKRWWSINT